jgi:hypothetical protein
VIKDFGELHYFLGIQVQRKTGELLLTKNGMTMKYYKELICSFVSLSRHHFVPLKNCLSPVELSWELKILQDIGALWGHSNI